MSHIQPFFCAIVVISKAKRMVCDMKKLMQLKPDKRKAYLNRGKGQEADYLYISPEMLNETALQMDVKAGAVQYKELLEFAGKKPSRVVVIDCSNEEEGLMAVSYLAGIYNWKDNAYDGMFENYGPEGSEEVPWDASSEQKEWNLKDYGERIDFESGECYEDEEDTWQESPCRIPIIPYFQIEQYNSNIHTVFEEQNFFTVGNSNQRGNQAYWLDARRESVCITATIGPYYTPVYGGGDNGLVSVLRRFSSNRHVFVLVIDETRANKNVEYTIGNFDDDDGMETFPSRKNTLLCEVILEYTASIVDVDASKEERQKYYQTLFENWALQFGRHLENKFPKKAIVDQIVSMRNPNKSELMEKIYKYILAQGEKDKILTKEDFKVLKKFKALGTTSKEEEQRSLEKLENNLVGMEAVKKQVYSIVDVMKYNKKRAAMGLGNSGYHNVHLLIGAPGTAKTTVAKLMGDIMCEQNLLPDNRFIAINGADLKGMFVGHSAPKTHKYFEDYDVILIDEAYSLTSEKDMDSFSEEAIAQLIIELENHGLDKLVMFAGYGGMHVKEADNKMKQFLKANPGIRSRINSTIYFDSYTPKEMLQIVHRQAENQQYQLNHDADELILQYFTERVEDEDFGNGREARSLLENISRAAAMRTMRMSENQITKKSLQELNVEDVKEAISQQKESFVNQHGQLRRKLGFL